MLNSADYKKFFTILMASILYALFSILLIIGPLVVGFYLGNRVKSLREGFMFAFTAAVVGFLIQHYLILQGVYWSFIIALSIILWHFISTMCLMVGVSAGYLFSGFDRGVKESGYGGDVGEVKEPGDEVAPETYIVCPVCGEPNEEDRSRCKSCGSEL